jgi:hypothetical protein
MRKYKGHFVMLARAKNIGMDLIIIGNSPMQCGDRAAKMVHVFKLGAKSLVPQGIRRIGYGRKFYPIL